MNQVTLTFSRRNTKLLTKGSHNVACKIVIKKRVSFGRSATAAAALASSSAEQSSVLLDSTLDNSYQIREYKKAVGQFMKLTVI